MILILILGLLLEIIAIIYVNYPNIGTREKPAPSVEPAQAYSVGEYLERIENESIRILEEREKKEIHVITLWWGLDGLRISDKDWEWIKKERTAARSLGNIDLSIQNSILNTSYYQDITECICNCTQSQLQNLRLSQVQLTQNVAILEALNTYYYQPTYSYYWFTGPSSVVTCGGSWFN